MSSTCMAATPLKNMASWVSSKAVYGFSLGPTTRPNVLRGMQQDTNFKHAGQSEQMLGFMDM